LLVIDKLSQDYQYNKKFNFFAKKRKNGGFGFDKNSIFLFTKEKLNHDVAFPNLFFKII
jgi:hypothetical protein